MSNIIVILDVINGIQHLFECVLAVYMQTSIKFHKILDGWRELCPEKSDSDSREYMN